MKQNRIGMNISKLRTLIETSKLNNREIADACNVSPTTLYNLLNGSDVKVSTLEALAKVLGVKIGYLFDEEPAAVNETELMNYRKEIERLQTLLDNAGGRSTKVVIEFDVDDDEFIRMGLKEKVIRVLNKK